VEINRVRHIALVDQREMDRLSLLYPDHWTGHCAIEGPGMIDDARSNRQEQFFHGERHIHRATLECSRSLRIVELMLHCGTSHSSITRRGNIARIGSATTSC